MNLFYKLAMLGCTVVALAAQAVSANDPRIEGVWKLNSERIDNGSVAHLPLGSVMTISRADDHIIVHITDAGGRTVTSAISGGGPVKLQSSFSLDARTLTQTTSGTNSQTGRAYSVTRVWQKQGATPNR
jgi:hypothetical protein